MYIITLGIVLSFNTWKISESESFKHVYVYISLLHTHRHICMTEKGKILYVSLILFLPAQVFFIYILKKRSNLSLSHSLTFLRVCVCHMQILPQTITSGGCTYTFNWLYEEYFFLKYLLILIN